MMNSLKSASLAAAMIISANSICSEASVANTAVNTVKNAVMSSISNNKALTAAVALAIMAKIRLNTKRRIAYEYDSADIKGLLNSYNIFDAESRATIMAFIDKYVVGVEVKLDEATTRTKNEDGSVFTIKTKKLTQKPFGLMGLVDAYVLQQMKKTTELVPAIAAFYLLVNDPSKVFVDLITKPAKEATSKS